MVHCDNCNSTFDIKYTDPTFYAQLTTYTCRCCGTVLPQSAVMKTTEGSGLLPDGSNYDKYKYPRPLFTVDVLITRYNHNSKEIELLVIKRKFNPFANRYALCGGFVDLKDNETIAHAAARELFEETNVQGVEVQQLGTFNVNDPRDYTVTVAHYAILNANQLGKLDVKAKDDASGYEWMPLLNYKEYELAFSHEDIVAALIEKLTSAPIETMLKLIDPEKVMLADATDAVNAIFKLKGLKWELNYGNHFNSYISSRGYAIIPTDEVHMTGKGRPRKFFKFIQTRIH